MNKYIKFFQVKMYIISPVTRYDINRIESKSSGLMEDSGCFTSGFYMVNLCQGNGINVQIK